MKLQAPTSSEEYSIIIRTIYSGPFIIPEGATLVSAVYDVSIISTRTLMEPLVSIEIEHCVNVTNHDCRSRISFAIGQFDYVKKQFIFTPVEGYIGTNTGTIIVKENCLLCIIYTAMSL